MNGKAKVQVSIVPSLLSSRFDQCFLQAFVERDALFRGTVQYLLLHRGQNHQVLKSCLQIILARMYVKSVKANAGPVVSVLIDLVDTSRTGKFAFPL